jgi:hypothetical protein
MRKVVWILLTAFILLGGRILQIAEPIPPRGNLFRSDSPDGSFTAHVSRVGFMPFAMPGQGGDSDGRIFIRDQDGWIVALRDFSIMSQWYDTHNRRWICTNSLGCRHFEMKFAASVVLPPTAALSLWDKIRRHVYWLFRAATFFVPCDGEPAQCPTFSVHPELDDSAPTVAFVR